MTMPTQTLLDRAADFFGDDVTWVMPDAVAGLSGIKHLQAVHAFRPDFISLKKMNVSVTPAWPDKQTGTIALNLPRQAEWAASLMAEALERLPEGGTLLTIAPNDLGGKRYAKMLGDNFELAFAESKHHCRLAALKRPKHLPPVVKEWKKSGEPQTVTGTELLSLPGTFSHGRIDMGSSLLVTHLPPLSGAVADFGAGWGYLAYHLLSGKNPPARIDLYEADDNALTCAKQNLGSWKEQTRFFWHDLLSEKTTIGYDSVIMNPPFHDMKTASPDIGRAFITAAHAALKPGGKLWMVANSHLPYEETLKTTFGNFQPVARENGFKVLSVNK